MTTSSSTARRDAQASVISDRGASAPFGKYFLTFIRGVARRAADDRRLTGMPRRYLEDVGMVPAETPALPGFEGCDPRVGHIALVGCG